MDKASDFESGDCRFESCQGRFVFVFLFVANFLKIMFPPGVEPGTLRVWSARDNHYTTETIYRSYGNCR